MSANLLVNPPTCLPIHLPSYRLRTCHPVNLSTYHPTCQLTYLLVSSICLPTTHNRTYPSVYFVNHPTYVPAFLPTCLPIHRLSYLPIHLPTDSTCLSTCLHTYLSTRQPSYLCANLPTYPPTCLPIHLPSDLLIYTSTSQPACRPLFLVKLLKSLKLTVCQSLFYICRLINVGKNI